MNMPNEIEESTATLWEKQGTIVISCYGNENTYYVDEFGIEFFCKNYPKYWTNEHGLNLPSN